MLIIYGVTRSRASRIVWLCHELGLPFEPVPVIQAYRLPDPTAPDAPMNTRSPHFTAISPAASIPVIDDDGLILSESMACTLHLTRQHGGPLAAKDAREQALFEQWSFYAATTIEPDALTLLFLHGRGQAQKGEDQALIANAAERLIRPMTVVESHLAQHGHPVGGRFTVADINLAEVIRYAQGYAPLMDQFPVTKAWLEACQSRPAFRQMWEARSAEPE